jgi:hypothetical protein
MLYSGASLSVSEAERGQSFFRRILGLILMDIGIWRICQVEIVAHPPAVPAR